MGFLSRIKLWLKIKTSSALEREEDPRQVMDYAYSQQQEFLRTVKQGLIEVATAKQQLQQQVDRQRAQIPKLEVQANQALTADREDFARIVLHRKQTALAELDGLEGQLAEVTEEEQRLAAAQQQIAARIAEFRTHREVVSARYTAAEAQVRINQSLTGVSGELGELSLALGRAEEKTQQMLARASALQTLIDGGVLETPFASGDLVEKELFKLRADNAVEEELGLLRSGQQYEQLPPPSE
jgi:phage shock protein A